jgi:hypothetical protein
MIPDARLTLALDTLLTVERLIGREVFVDDDAVTLAAALGPGASLSRQLGARKVGNN